MANINPWDPYDMRSSKGISERYLRDYMEHMYRQLRDEIHKEMSYMRPPAVYGGYDPGMPATTGKTHSGKKVEAKDIKALSKAAPRLLTQRMPDGVFPGTGYRAWRAVLTKDGWRLKALGQEEIWEPKKKIEAKCTAGKAHPAPNFDCECGVWAFASPNELLAALDSYQPSVIGPISIWGRIIECENGFRAQYAYPTELWLLDDSLEELGWIYGVPIRTAGEKK